VSEPGARGAPAGRHYEMDWLRIGAFMLLILYHVGMFFVPWGWHVKTAEPVEWAAIPMLATSAWRLALLFVVSGYASAALFAKDRRIGRFLGDRSGRLLVPLLFGMALVCAPQPWVELQFKHGYADGFWAFWRRDYFRFGELDGLMLPTWQHLWFVAYLWVYTLALALLLLLPRALRSALQGAAERAFAGGLVLGVPLALLALRLWLGWPGAEETHDLVGDGYAHTLYLPLFLFGYFLRGAEAPWRGIRRYWPVALALSLAAYAVVAAIEFTWPGTTRPPTGFIALFAGARIVQAWGAIVGLIGLADRYWNRDHRWRRTLTEAVFPFYIVHQTVIVLVGWYLLPARLPAWVEFAVLVAATVAGCWAFYLGGRAITPLRPLIGLRLKKRHSATGPRRPRSEAKGAGV